VVSFDLLCGERSIIICAVVQVVVNMVTIVQIIVQCGPNPYQTVGILLLVLDLF
jgi:hypothetical protein